jgi:hypothetical protein
MIGIKISQFSFTIHINSPFDSSDNRTKGAGRSRQAGPYAKHAVTLNNYWCVVRLVFSLHHSGRDFC